MKNILFYIHCSMYFLVEQDYEMARKELEKAVRQLSNIALIPQCELHSILHSISQIMDCLESKNYILAKDTLEIQVIPILLMLGKKSDVEWHGVDIEEAYKNIADKVTEFSMEGICKNPKDITTCRIEKAMDQTASFVLEQHGISWYLCSKLMPKLRGWSNMRRVYRYFERDHIFYGMAYFLYLPYCVKRDACNQIEIYEGNLETIQTILIWCYKTSDSYRFKNVKVIYDPECKQLEQRMQHIQEQRLTVEVMVDSVAYYHLENNKTKELLEKYLV